ncbi:relaxase/mobilization nuclease domain-containing protein [Methylibium sp.]|uniref:relaxase/mobilization nuclease domain-containing protein n=1 Tax=Methylibium sp. TaxID=2067992 RepID=UPI002DBCB3F3|nr:hypothetical protein [Methylibium sp.]
MLDFEPLVGLSIPGSSGRAGPVAKRARFETQRAVYERIARNVGGHAQVMVKITSKGYNHGQAGAHASYITRHGKLTAEDELGFVLGDAAAVREKLDGWRLTRDTIFLDGTRRLRQTLHFTLGMPAGTDPSKVLEGARRFAQREFAGHQYVMVLHEPQSDPKPGAPAHPHVHLALRALSEDGYRISVDKEDLLYFRSAFAEQMRLLGVQANASRRIERGETKRSRSRALQEVIKRDKTAAKLWRARRLPDLSLPPGTSMNEALRMAKDDYRLVVDQLSRSNREADLQFARAARHWVDQFPIVRATRELMDERAQLLEQSLSQEAPSRRAKRNDERSR